MSLSIPKYDRVSISLLRENAWNPNKMTAFMYEKAVESLSEFGFIAPIVVRDDGGTYQIIDGAHRYRAARDLGYTEVPVILVDGIDDGTAKKLTLVLNELHGQPDSGKLSELLGGLLDEYSISEMLHSLPFTPDSLKGFVGLDGFELPELPKMGKRMPKEEPWSERLFRMPTSVNEMVGEALQAAKDKIREETGKTAENWQALEVICAEYLAGTL